MAGDESHFRDAALFAAEARAGAAALSPSTPGDPHLTPEWFALLAETAMPAGAQLGLFPVAARGAANSFLPLLVSPEAPQRITGLSNFYTPLFGLVNENAADLERLTELARQFKNTPSGCAELRFAPMDPASASYALLREALTLAGWVVDDYFCFGNWYQPVRPGEATAYLAGRPSKLRNTLRRAEKSLARLPGYSLDIVCDAADGLDAAMAAFVEVYDRSWKEPEPFPEFIPGLCRLAAGRGWLRLGVIRIDGRPAAAQLWLVEEKTAYIVKLAYDPEFTKASPGTVLTAALCRHVIDVDGVEQIDYLIGDDDYKRDWMSQRRERRGIVAYNLRRWRGVVGALRHFTGRLRSLF